MYKPEPRIIRYLKEYDRDLDAHWDRERERWVVSWNGKEVKTVQNDDGSYRPLDERLVTWARLADAWQHKSAKEYCRILDENQHRLTMAEKARANDEFSQMMKEDGHRMLFGGPMIQGWSLNK